MTKRFMLLLLLFIAACSTTPEPTPDISAFVTGTITAKETATARTAPTLNAPDDDSVFDNIAAVKLAWSWVRPLADDEVYDLRVWADGADHNGIARTPDNHFDLTNYLLDRKPGKYHWTVTVVKKDSPGGPDDQLADLPPDRSFTLSKFAMNIMDLPAGFESKLYAHLPITQPTVVTFDSNGAMVVLSLDGHIVKMTDNDHDGYAETSTMLFEDPGDKVNYAVGLAYHDGKTYISDAGRISILTDSDKDGKLDSIQPIVQGLPTWKHTFHSNNGIAFGPDNKLYVGVGATTDHGPIQDQYEASILRMNPDGSDLEVFATGFRNPYDLVFSPKGELFTADNSPDEPDDTLAYLPPEELDFVQQGKNYGFPYVFGVAGAVGDYTGPVNDYYTSSASSGITYYSADQFPPAYRNGIFLAQFGTGAAFPKQMALQNGQMVIFDTLTADGKGGYTGKWQPFAKFRTDLGVYNPIDVTVGPDGALYVVEWNTTTVYRITYTGTPSSEATPESIAESTPEATDNLVAQGEAIFHNGTNGAPPCITCHVLDKGITGVGPSLLGINDVAASRVAGLSAEAYVRQSILHPNDFIVPGYIAGVMYQGFANQLQSSDVDALVAYVLSLKK
ncbi:MAG: PQQ-dependent sugar dehydrogenase [Anaerolineae bacterium]|nr:PQQ-dependent sugar dehydrogenase [Anaerolineae bacterium]